jgi:DNA processing protein
MMTARLAFSYDRDVYALPGRVDDIRSQGCNLLIRSKVAEPLTSVPEFLDSLGMKAGSSAGAATDREILELTYKSSAAADRVDQMARLLTIIRKNRGITIEELAEVSALGYARTVELTSRLETDGFICTDLLQRCSINPVKR